MIKNKQNKENKVNEVKTLILGLQNLFVALHIKSKSALSLTLQREMCKSKTFYDNGT